jgi:6-phosphogluconolactonase
MSLAEHNFPDRRRLFAGLAAELGEMLGEIVRKRRKASIAMPGGTTPGPLFESLSHMPLPWSKISVTLTDERWVSPEDPASNEWLVRDQLLKRRAADATFIGFKTNHAKATGGVTVTDRRLAPLMPLDICVLGMGPDGHIASLIPGAEGYDAAVAESNKRSTAGLVSLGAAGSPDRMSLTLNAIASSKRIILLFMGQEKMNIFTDAKQGKGVTPVKDLLAHKKAVIDAYWAP